MKAYVNYSYWELKQYFRQFDLIVIGGGIVGLSAAISFRQKNRKANILILERGILPSGASTKNAGFACFGSPSELLDDLSRMDEKTVWQTVEMRWKGLELLKKRLGEKNMAFKNLGGFELFDKKEELDKCLIKLDYLNKMIFGTIGLKRTYADVSRKAALFGKISGMLVNRHEGQIDTGFMMHNLLQLALRQDIRVLNSIHVTALTSTNKGVEIESNAGTFKAAKTIVATNGFAKELLDIKDVEPARAQVLVTKPVKDLKIKGTFHYQAGYYYFRNIDDRILFGGGRNLDFKTENTSTTALNPNIQQHLDKLLKEVILPGIHYEVEHRWSGIMGVGSEKKPIVEFTGKNVLAAVRMGGMGVAIGSMVGKMAAEKISEA